jgi:hypothetical protein
MVVSEIPHVNRVGLGSQVRRGKGQHSTHHKVAIGGYFEKSVLMSAPGQSNSEAFLLGDLRGKFIDPRGGSHQAFPLQVSVGGAQVEYKANVFVRKAEEALMVCEAELREREGSGTDVGIDFLGSTGLHGARGRRGS